MMSGMADPLIVAKTASGADLQLLPALANRHGLITGATGTGKTVSLQLLADRFSRSAFPCSWPTSKAICRGSRLQAR